MQYGRDVVPTYGCHSRANCRARWPAAAGLGEGLVRSDAVEPFGLRFVLVTQPVDQTQRLTLRERDESPRRPCVGGSRVFALLRIFQECP